MIPFRIAISTKGTLCRHSVPRKMDSTCHTMAPNEHYVESASDTLDLVEVGWKMENGAWIPQTWAEPFVELWTAKFTLL